MKYLVVVMAVVVLLGLGVFTPQREPISASSQERPFVVRVPQDFPTIQQAIDAVAEGGTVLIAPGTYPESIRIAKSLRLRGASRELVRIQADKAIDIDAEKPIQVYLSDLAVRAQQLGIRIVGEVQATIESVTITSEYLGMELVGSWVFLTDVTVSGAQYGILAPFGNSLYLQRATIKGNRIGIALVVEATLTVYDSIIKENDIGIAALIGILGGRGKLDIFRNSLSANRLAAIAVIGSWGGVLVTYLSNNEISANGVGVYLGYDFYQENQKKFQRPIPRLVDMFQNKIIGNLYYGLALQRKECEDEILSKILEWLFPLPLAVLEEASLESTVFIGWDNEIRENGKADLCPPDYPWPPGFRR